MHFQYCRFSKIKKLKKIYQNNGIVDYLTIVELGLAMKVGRPSWPTLLLLILEAFSNRNGRQRKSAV